MPGNALAPGLLRESDVGSFRRPRVIVLTALLLAGQARGAATTPPSPARLERVALRESGAPGADVTLSRAVEPSVHRLADPPRVYVDLKDTVLAPQVARTLGGRDAVKQVRVGQFDPKTVRIVVELAAGVPVDVAAEGKTMAIVAGERPARSRAAAAPAPPPPTVKDAAPAVEMPVPASAVPSPPAPAAEPHAASAPRHPAGRTDEPLARPAVPARVAFPSTLGDAIARRSAGEDWAGVVAIYVGHPYAVRRHADPATRAAVVDALRELGLSYSARKLLGPSQPGEAAALRVARAEMAVAAGDADDAAALVTGLDDAAVDPVLVPKLRRLRVRLALARSDFEGAAAGIAGRAIPELRAELAHAATVAGRTALHQRSCRRAVVAFRHALDADGGRAARAAAAAGLVRASLACGDADATMTGLGVLAESPHPLLRRVAAAIASTQAEAERHAAAATRQGG